MPDMLAIVSKAVYESEAKHKKLGSVLPLSGYASANKQLHKLGEDGRLFLVTVRPPKESLWLVAVLEQPVFAGVGWSAKPNTYRITDITHIKDQLRFDSGKGIQAKPGALGMSLQTPRVLTPADAKLILDAATAQKVKVPAPRPVNLAAHDDKSALPCLCKRCLPAAPARVHTASGEFVRAKVEIHERVLWFWVPVALTDDLEAVARAVTARLQNRIQPFPDPKASKDDSGSKDDEDGE